MGWNEDNNKDYFYYLFQLDKFNIAAAENKLLTYLNTLGLSCSWEELKYKQNRLTTEYPPNVLSEAEDIIKSNIEVLDSDTNNLTLSNIYTVDNPSTRDYDDAISLQCKNGIYYVRLFISNVAKYISSNSSLFTYAEKKAIFCIFA